MGIGGGTGVVTGEVQIKYNGKYMPISKLPNKYFEMLYKGKDMRVSATKDALIRLVEKGILEILADKIELIDRRRVA